VAVAWVDSSTAQRKCLSQVDACVERVGVNGRTFHGLPCPVYETCHQRPPGINN